VVAVHRACSSDSRSYEIVAHGACDTTLESLCMCAVREREGGGERPREKGLRVRHETTMTRAETAIQRGEKRETGEIEYRVAVTLESVLARVWSTQKSQTPRVRVMSVRRSPCHAGRTLS
jgi:hypothetical protein